jgi:hypothetical protein
MVCLSGEDTLYIIRYFDLINFSVLWVALSENEKIRSLEVAGALIWAKLQLSLWNFSIMLPITSAWMDDCYSVHFNVWFVLHVLWRVFCQNTKPVITPSMMNGISPNFYCMLIWWGYMIYRTIFFIRIICTAPHPKSYLAHPWIHTHSGGIPCEFTVHLVVRDDEPILRLNCNLKQIYSNNNF